MSLLWQIVFFDRLKADVVFVPDYEKHLVAVPNVQQGKIAHAWIDATRFAPA
jgi:hypothetical protein